MAYAGLPRPLPPLSRGDQVLPFHFAMCLADNPPAVVKSPATITSVPLMAIARAEMSRPLPNADQVLPFHLAMWLAGDPPAVEKSPPTYTSVPLTPMAYT